ncbi:MAG: hypothetical protein IJT87_08420 [Ruminiclostridium sp.]|nr:hypothetical protein [Ruminiclostridium sp.]
MYKCKCCGEINTRVLPVYDRHGIASVRCVCCGSGDITESREKCGICGKALWRGESAFEAGNMLICRKCAAEVTV